MKRMQMPIVIISLAILLTAVISLTNNPFRMPGLSFAVTAFAMICCHGFARRAVTVPVGRPAKFAEENTDAAPRLVDTTSAGYYLEPKKDRELTLEATVANLSTLLAFVDAELEALDCPMKTQMQIDVAVEEIFVNIALYAYAPETGFATMRLETASDPKCVTITFLDRGMPFNPLDREDPDVTLTAEKRDIGGLGIYMVKKSMDAVSYAYEDGQNILTIRKIIPG